MTENRQQFEAKIRGFISQGLGIDSDSVIPGNDSAPSPRGLYASVLLIDDDFQNYPIVSVRDVDDETVRLDNRISRRANYSVQCYRAGSYDAILRFTAWAFSDVAVIESESINIKIHRISPIRQFDEVINDSFEQRAGIDLIINYWHDTSYIVNALANADIRTTDK